MGGETLDFKQEETSDERARQRWMENARENPFVITKTKKGLGLIVVRTPIEMSEKVEYRAFEDTPENRALAKKDAQKLAHKSGRVAWLFPGPLFEGTTLVTNARVYDKETNGESQRKQGIGTVMYDLLEKDVQASGGKGIEPQWGQMSNEAIAFWRKRIGKKNPTLVEHIEKFGWNEIPFTDLPKIKEELFKET